MLGTAKCTWPCALNNRGRYVDPSAVYARLLAAYLTVMASSRSPLRVIMQDSKAGRSCGSACQQACMRSR